MGQRTQIGINVKFVSGKGREYTERGVYYYQWGGYHPGMFENLIGLFINAKNYVQKAKRDDFYMNEFERKFAYIQGQGNKYCDGKGILRFPSELSGLQ